MLARLTELPVGAAARRAVADETGVYAVGGAVRDLLLGRRPTEVDLVVEGDAVPVARRAAQRLPDGRATIHERFRTATVRSGDVAFDLASARRETYERPGALPTVQLGVTLADDLPRRDFTVNAIALALDDGRLIHVEGALDDLERGVLRVLHPRSFDDDPTRAFRLARYAARLGFAPDPETAELARRADPSTLSPARIGAELRKLAAEDDPAAAFAALPVDIAPVPADPEAVARALADPRTTGRVSISRRAPTSNRDTSPASGDRAALALGAAFHALAPEAFERWLKDLAFPKQERRAASLAHQHVRDDG